MVPSSVTVGMAICKGSRTVLFPILRRTLLLAMGPVAMAGAAGCTDALRTGTHGTGGTMATGGRATSDAAVASGAVPGAGGTSAAGTRSGGASGSVGDAGGTAGANGCPEVRYEYCVESCFTDRALTSDASCSDGAWVCRAGWVLASSCPERACRVTPGACCDFTTGLVSENACAENGYRASCPDGSGETYAGTAAWCVPQSLMPGRCAPLDGQPCTGPAVRCSDTSVGMVTCWCSQYGTDAATGTWYCSFYIGP